MQILIKNYCHHERNAEGNFILPKDVRVHFYFYLWASEKAKTVKVSNDLAVTMIMVKNVTLPLLMMAVKRVEAVFVYGAHLSKIAPFASNPVHNTYEQILVL